MLRALDKVTARTVTLEVPIETPVTFRTLEITAHVCDKRPPEESPEAASSVDIVEKREGRTAGYRISRLDVCLQPRAVGDAASGL